MKQRKRVLAWFASILVTHGVAITLAVETRPPGILPGTKVYIAPMNDFELFLKAAIYIKEVPLVVLKDRGLADCEITGAFESGETGLASIRVIDLRSSVAVFTYERVWTEDKQDLAIDFAKQLKKKIEQDERLARKSAVAKPKPRPEVKVAVSSRPQSEIVVPKETPVQSEPNTTPQATSPAQQAAVTVQSPQGPEPASAVPSVELTRTAPVSGATSSASTIAPAPAKIAANTPLSVQIVCPEGIHQVPFSSSRPDRKTIPCAEPVTIIGGRPPWIRVRTSDGLEGNVSSRFLEK